MINNTAQHLVAAPYKDPGKEGWKAAIGSGVIYSGLFYGFNRLEQHLTGTQWSSSTILTGSLLCGALIGAFEGLCAHIGAKKHNSALRSVDMLSSDDGINAHVPLDLMSLREKERHPLAEAAILTGGLGAAWAAALQLVRKAVDKTPFNKTALATDTLSGLLFASTSGVGAYRDAKWTNERREFIAARRDALPFTERLEAARDTGQEAAKIAAR